MTVHLFQEWSGCALRLCSPDFAGYDLTSYSRTNRKSSPAAGSESVRAGIHPVRMRREEPVGLSYRAACKECRHRFRVNLGGGFVFHVLRCTRCGKAKQVSFDELGEVHLQYLKGLEAPYCVATAGHDQAVKDTYTGPAISEATYARKVQRFAGSCRCGGRFTFRAKPRCPKCLSTRLEDTREEFILYD